MLSFNSVLATTALTIRLPSMGDIVSIKSFASNAKPMATPADGSKAIPNVENPISRLRCAPARKKNIPKIGSSIPSITSCASLARS